MECQHPSAVTPRIIKINWMVEHLSPVLVNQALSDAQVKFDAELNEAGNSFDEMMIVIKDNFKFDLGWDPQEWIYDAKNTFENRVKSSWEAFKNKIKKGSSLLSAASELESALDDARKMFEAEVKYAVEEYFSNFSKSAAKGVGGCCTSRVKKTVQEYVKWASVESLILTFTEAVNKMVDLNEKVVKKSRKKGKSSKMLPKQEQKTVLTTPVPIPPEETQHDKSIVVEEEPEMLSESLTMGQVEEKMEEIFVPDLLKDTQQSASRKSTLKFEKKRMNQEQEEQKQLEGSRVDKNKQADFFEDNFSPDYVAAVEDEHLSSPVEKSVEEEKKIMKQVEEEGSESSTLTLESITSEEGKESGQPRDNLAGVMSEMLKTIKEINDRLITVQPNSKVEDLQIKQEQSDKKKKKGFSWCPCSQ